MADFLQQLNSPAISHVRHKGAMLAFDLIDSDGNPDVAATNALKKHAFEHGLLLASCGTYFNTIRVMMPLTIPDEVLDEALQIIKAFFKE